jgi:hypothetical protein
MDLDGRMINYSGSSIEVVNGSNPLWNPVILFYGETVSSTLMIGTQELYITGRHHSMTRSDLLFVWTIFKTEQADICYKPDANTTPEQREMKVEAFKRGYCSVGILCLTLKI